MSRREHPATGGIGDFLSAYGKSGQFRPQTHQSLCAWGPAFQFQRSPPVAHGCPGYAPVIADRRSRLFLEGSKQVAAQNESAASAFSLSFGLWPGNQGVGKLAEANLSAHGINQEAGVVKEHPSSSNHCMAGILRHWR